MDRKMDSRRQNTEAKALMGMQGRDYEERKEDSEAWVVPGPALLPTALSPPSISSAWWPAQFLWPTGWESSYSQDSPCPCGAGLSVDKPGQRQRNKCVTELQDHC